MKRRLLSISFLAATFVFLTTASLAYAQTADPCSGWVCLINPLKFIGVDDPGALVQRSFIGFAGLMGAIAIAFTVFSGFKLIIAQNEEGITEARSSLTWSVLGFIVSLLSFTLVSGTAKFLGFDPGKNSDPNHVVNYLPKNTFVGAMNYIMINFLGIVGFAATLMIIYYGYRYVTSAGNEEAVEKAKTGLRWSLIGLVIVLLAFTFISSTRQYLLGGI